jgi:glycine C-acetyltransferase
MAKWDFLTAELAALEREGLLTHPRTVESPQGAWITVDGKHVLNLCANNYLGFANHPRLKEAAHAAIERFGVGPAAVRSIVGTLSLHHELEQKLAAFKGIEATLTFQSGFNANLAVIPALVQEGDVIFSDELNHASIIDGCRLSRAQVVRFRHRDPEDLDAALRRTMGARRRLVITDGVFSMDGEIAPLPDIVRVAAPYAALVMVDDAHGEGVLGRAGRGITDHFGLHGQIDIEIGTLSKAFGVVGGYVAGSRVLIEYLTQGARPFLFSSATPAADIAACIAAVEILQQSEQEVQRLWQNTHFFQKQMRALGFDLGQTQTPITPIMVGEAHAARAFSAELFKAGVFAQALAYPTVPRGTSRLRAMLSATHTREDLELALQTLAEVGRACQIIP